MAERFYGPDGDIVHFSNGAVEELYAALIRLGQRQPQTPQIQEFVSDLMHSLENEGMGTRAFVTALDDAGRKLTRKDCF